MHAACTRKYTHKRARMHANAHACTRLSTVTLGHGNAHARTHANTLTLALAGLRL